MKPEPLYLLFLLRLPSCGGGGGEEVLSGIRRSNPSSTRLRPIDDDYRVRHVRVHMARGGAKKKRATIVGGRTKNKRLPAQREPDKLAIHQSCEEEEEGSPSRKLAEFSQRKTREIIQSLLSDRHHQGRAIINSNFATPLQCRVCGYPPGALIYVVQLGEHKATLCRCPPPSAIFHRLELPLSARCILKALQVFRWKTVVEKLRNHQTFFRFDRRSKTLLFRRPSHRASISQTYS